MTTTIFRTKVHLSGKRFTFLKQGRQDLGIDEHGRGRCVDLSAYDVSSGQELFPVTCAELRSGNEVYGKDIKGLKPHQEIEVKASVAQQPSTQD